MFAVGGQKPDAFFKIFGMFASHVNRKSVDTTKIYNSNFPFIPFERTLIQHVERREMSLPRFFLLLSVT